MATNVELNRLDFGALRTLRLVYRLGSFSAAAETLDIKQSTVSYTIDRIRKAVDDPLFIRQGGGIAATDRCRGLIPLIDRMLADAEALVAPGGFDPARSRGQISIACSSITKILLMPALIRRLAAEAPGIVLNIMVGPYDATEILLQGQVDIALLFGASDVPAGIYVKEGLIRDHAVCMMDKAHPLAGRTRLTRQDMERFRHVEIRPWHNFRHTYVQTAEALGIALQRGVIVNDPAEAALLVAGTDFLAGGPSTYVRKFNDIVATAPFPFDHPISLNMFWTATSHRTPLNKWVRRVIEDEAAKIRATPIPSPLP